MRRRWWFALVFVLAAGPAEAVEWQDAVQRLSFERTQAERCVGVLKRYGDDAARARGAFDYGAAKAEYDGVINGLIVVLAHGKSPDSLDGLQDHLRSGFAERQAFCDSVRPLLPSRPGEKGPLVDIAKGAIEPVIKALTELWFRHLDDDDIMRKTIQTQLEGAKWPDFGTVPPLS